MRGMVLAAVFMVAICGIGVAADIAVPVPTHTAGPTQANVINPYELLGFSRDQLAQRFPKLPDAELDKLVFEIADINSMRSLAL